MDTVYITQLGAVFTETIKGGRIGTATTLTPAAPATASVWCSFLSLRTDFPFFCSKLKGCAEGRRMQGVNGVKRGHTNPCGSG